jgi:hypothetical protein
LHLTENRYILLNVEALAVACGKPQASLKGEKRLALLLPQRRSPWSPTKEEKKMQRLFLNDL